tara:strand:+ start:1349 stop:1816 length:468 start_codon:yes stop_codon:yes gene_type:complete
MLHDKAVKKVEKALDRKVELIGNCRYGVAYNGYILSWLVQRQWKVENDKIVEDGPLEAHNWHVRRVDDHSDSMVDYFAGSFVDNVTQLINYVKPPAPKFELGALVKGKDNKRANRQGYANRVGVVTRAGRYMGIQWAGDDKAHWTSYPQNDFVLA